MQRCQAHPSTFAIAAFRPAWASEIASWTPIRPRLTGSRRKSVQNASVSASPTASEESQLADGGAESVGAPRQLGVAYDAVRLFRQGALL